MAIIQESSRRERRVSRLKQVRVKLLYLFDAKIKVFEEALYIVCSEMPSSSRMIFESSSVGECCDLDEYYTKVIDEVDYRRSNEILTSTSNAPRWLG